MPRVMWGAVAVLVCAGIADQTPGREAPARSVVLGDIAWPAAAEALTSSSVVVVPVGPSAVEHGPHLPLDTDERLARSLAARVAAITPVVVAPPMHYHSAGLYQDYPGSSTLTVATARDATVEVVRSLSRFGPRRFYLLTPERSVRPALDAAAKVLADAGILMTFSDPDRGTASISSVHHLATGHADEIETSMMLYLDSGAVHMEDAPVEFAEGTGALHASPAGSGIYSRTGVVGDARAATADKGRALVDALVASMVEDIGKVRTGPLPQARATLPLPPAPATQTRPSGATNKNGCTPQDEREILAVGSKFSHSWADMDAEALSLLFTDNGDIRHPDGTIERGRVVIRADRNALFQKPEYRGSVHPVVLSEVRCLGNGTAVVDGKWELRNLGDVSGARTPFSGLVTLVVRGSGTDWLIEAWRYTIDPQNGPPPTNVLKTPGFIGRGGGGIH